MTLPWWLDNLIAYCIQIALLVLVGGVLPWLLRLRLPKVMYLYWNTLLVTCLALPVIQAWNPMQSSPVPSILPLAEAEQIGQVLGLTDLHRSFPVYEAIAIVLALGVAVRLFYLLLGTVRLGRYRSRGKLLDPVPPDFKKIQSRLRVDPQICISLDVDSPATFGAFRPVILLPSRFLAMEPERQTTILCHELLHVRRRDWVFVVVEGMVRAFLWFHPAIHWLLSRIQLSREQVVDQEVLLLTGNRRCYVESLLQLAAEGIDAQPLPASLFLREPHLAQRVALMVEEVSMSRPRRLLSVATIVVTLVWTGHWAVWSFPLTSGAIAKAKGEQLATTEDGRIVILTEDGTWKYAAAEVYPVTHEDLVNPKILKKTTPAYTEEALAAGIEGEVVLSCILRKTGVVEDCTVKKELSHGLTERAVEEISTNWRFEPGQMNGEPVDVQAFIEVVYKVPQTKKQ